MGHYKPTGWRLGVASRVTLGVLGVTLVAAGVVAARTAWQVERPPGTAPTLADIESALLDGREPLRSTVLLALAALAAVGIAYRIARHGIVGKGLNARAMRAEAL